MRTSVVVLLALALALVVACGRSKDAREEDDAALGPQGRAACEQLRDWHVEHDRGLMSLPGAQDAFERSYVDVCMGDESTRSCAARAAAGGSGPNVGYDEAERCGVVLMLAVQRVLMGQQRPELLKPPRALDPPSGTPEERRACERVRDWLKEQVKKDTPEEGDEAQAIYTRGLDEQLVDVCLSDANARRCAVALLPALTGGARDASEASCATVLDDLMWRAQLRSMQHPPL